MPAKLSAKDHLGFRPNESQLLRLFFGLPSGLGCFPLDKVDSELGGLELGKKREERLKLDLNTL